MRINSAPVNEGSAMSNKLKITSEVIGRLSEISKSATYGYVSAQVKFYDMYAWDDPRVPWYRIGMQEFSGAPEGGDGAPSRYKDASAHAAAYLLGAVSEGRQQHLTAEDHAFLADVQATISPLEGETEAWWKYGTHSANGPVSGVEAGRLSNLIDA